MAMHGQPSAPSYQNYHSRWHQPSRDLTTENVPPLFDYELYQESRREPAMFSDACGPWTGGGGGAQGCLGINARYENQHPNRHGQMGNIMQHQQYQYSSHQMSSDNAPPYNYGSTSVLQSAVGPPAYMVGGGFDNPFQKAEQQSRGGWSSASQRNAAGAHYSSSLDQLEDQHHVPWISLAITIAHAVTFIIVMQRNDCPSHTKDACLNPLFHEFAFQPFSENPLLGPSAKTLLSLGALESNILTKAREGWRLLSAMWLHAGMLHIFGTASGMLAFGIPLERQLGFVKVGLIYVLSGFMGSILSTLMVHGRVSVGASGACMGLLGATLSSIVVNWKSYRHRLRVLIGVIFFVALNTVFGLMPLVDNFTHVGGAVMGFLVGNLFFIRHDLRCWKSSVVYDRNDMPHRRKHEFILDIAWLLSLGVLIVATTMGLFALFSGMNIGNGCSWCQYLTCAPSHYWKCSGDTNLGCNPTSVGAGLRVTCASGQYFDYTVPYVNKLTPEIESLCVKACI